MQNLMEKLEGKNEKIPATKGKKTSREDKENGKTSPCYLTVE